MKKSFVVALMCSSLMLTGCLDRIKAPEITTTEYTGVTVIGIQNNRPEITEPSEDVTETVVVETTEAKPVEIWVYNNFDGVDIEGESFEFSKRKTAYSKEEEETFINEFLATYNAHDPVCLLSIDEYSVYEYVADNGTVLVYEDDYYYDESLLEIEAEPDEGEVQEEVQEGEEGTTTNFKKVIECYYVDMTAFKDLGTLPSTVTNQTWDRLDLISGVVDVIDAWNINKPSDFEPVTVDRFSQIDFLMTESDLENNEGKMFIDEYGRPVFARYYKSTGNTSELFIYNDLTGELYMRVSFSGTAFAPKEDHEEGLIMAIYYFDEVTPDSYSIRNQIPLN